MQQIDVFTHYMASPIGTIEIISDEKYILKVVPSEKAPDKASDLTDRPKVIQECVKELNNYFSGNTANFTVPVSQKGTEFQEQVWSELIKIPAGTTISYADLAKRAGKPKACRAAGSANGKNDIIIIIPCHRVINTDGKLGGYAYGLEMKRFLLNHEKQFRDSGSLTLNF